MARKIKGKKLMKGGNVFQDIDNWLREKKILSKVVGVAAPVLTALSGPLAPVEGAALAGSAALLNQLGYGGSMLSISPQGQRLGQSGSGMMISKMMRGRIQKLGKGVKQPMMGKGIGAFNSVPSSFGRVQF